MSANVPTSDEFAALAARVAELEARLTAEPWPEWMSVETAAKYLDCSPERIRKLIARGLPHHQEGKGCRVFLHRPELDAYLNEGSTS